MVYVSQLSLDPVRELLSMKQIGGLHLPISILQMGTLVMKVC